VTILEKLRQDIERVIDAFEQKNKTLSQNRQQNIREIREIIISGNAVKVRTDLVQYVEKLSTGFASLWPFLEVNRFKSVLKAVIYSPAYLENAILRAMVMEAGRGMDQTKTSHSHKGVLDRIDKLEKSLATQQDELSFLNQEVDRLKKENLFLIKTIAAFNGRNTMLKEENTQIKKEKLDLENELQGLKQKYDQLVTENDALKSQLTKQTEGNSQSFSANKPFSLRIKNDQIGSSEVTAHSLNF
jgi:FtsZ-binding cell division protein ZapB